MFSTPFSRTALAYIALLFMIPACGGTAQVKPTEDKFYKSPYVRRCLQYDKEQMTSQSKACWARLLRRVQTEDGFQEEAELSDADVAKIRENTFRSDDQLAKLQKELDACMELPSPERDKRIKCYQAYLDRHGKKLSRAQRFEIENTIATLKRSKERVSGAIEATIEHAGKLMGVQIHEENSGIRIDTVAEGPGKQAGLREQGLIVAIDDVKVTDLESAERIARLESCEDDSVVLLVRYGGMGDITYGRCEVCCGQKAKGKKQWEVVLPQETCTEENSPEMSLGVFWCYIAKDGVLLVEEVCADSPAARAGMRPDHEYVSINGVSLLGKTYLQITQILKEFPAKTLAFSEKGGTLVSPAPLEAPPLDIQSQKRCWKAFEATMDKGELPGPK